MSATHAAIVRERGTPLVVHFGPFNVAECETFMPCPDEDEQALLNSLHTFIHDSHYEHGPWEQMKALRDALLPSNGEMVMLHGEEHFVLDPDEPYLYQRAGNCVAEVTNGTEFQTDLCSEVDTVPDGVYPATVRLEDGGLEIVVSFDEENDLTDEQVEKTLSRVVEPEVLF